MNTLTDPATRATDVDAGTVTAIDAVAPRTDPVSGTDAGAFAPELTPELDPEARAEVAPEHEDAPEAGPLASWLASRGLTEQRRNEVEPAEQLFADLASAAMTWPDVDRLLRTIRGRLNTGNLNRGAVGVSSDPAGRAAALAAAEDLVMVGALVHARLAGDRLVVEPNPKGESTRARLRSFLNGRWLELGALGVAQLLHRDDPTVEVASNLELRDAQGRAYELDLVIAGPDGTTIVECKAGRQANECLPRFRDVCDVAGLTGDRAVYVAARIEPAEARRISTFHDLAVIRPLDLADHLRGLAGA